MTAELTTPDDVDAALRQRMRVGYGLTVPYARKWAIGGCEPSHSLWSFPHDEIATLAAGLLQLDASVVATDTAVVIGLPSGGVWVAADGQDERASTVIVGRHGEDRAMYVGNSAEVVLEIIRGLSDPPGPIPNANEILQIGFPGIHDAELTYVGSWQWYIHGEARDDEYVHRAAHATLGAIQTKLSRDADINDAVTLYLKHYPGDNDVAFDARYGSVATAIRHTVRALLDEAMNIEVDWNSLSLNEAGDFIESVMHKRRPELSATALTCIGNYYTYLVR
jgi:hypothetical protein